MKKKKEYVKENDYYRRLRCGKRYTHQAGVIRHLNKSCGVVKDKVIHQCTFCDMVFPYKSVLIRHEQTHIDDIAVPSFVPRSLNLDGSIGSLAVVDHQVPQCSKQSDFQPEVQDDVHWSIFAPTALQDISNDQLRHSQLDSDLHRLAQCYMILFNDYMILFNDYMILFNDYMILFNDYMILFNDYMILFTDYMILFNDYMILFNDDIIQ